MTVAGIRISAPLGEGDGASGNGPEIGKKMLLPVGFEQQLRGGNEALIDYMKPNFKVLVKQKKQII